MAQDFIGQVVMVTNEAGQGHSTQLGHVEIGVPGSYTISIKGDAPEMVFAFEPSPLHIFLSLGKKQLMYTVPCILAGVGLLAWGILQVVVEQKGILKE